MKFSIFHISLQYTHTNQKNAKFISQQKIHNNGEMDTFLYLLIQQYKNGYNLKSLNVIRTEKNNKDIIPIL